MQRFVARRIMADLEPLAETLAGLVDELPTMPLYLGVLAIVRVGAADGVTRQPRCWRRSPPSCPRCARDAFRLATLSMAAEAAVALDDIDVASAVLDPLRRDDSPRTSCSARAARISARKARYIGLAALAIGEIDDAVTHLRDAAERARTVNGRAIAGAEPTGPCQRLAATRCAG